MRVVQIVLAAALVVASVAAPAADTPGSNPSVRTPSVAERLASARKAIDIKDWPTAMNELNAAVREDPRNADVHNLLGYSYRKRSGPDVSKAFEHYYTALKLDPRHKGAHEYIGQAYLLEKKPAEAEKHLAELEKICGGQQCLEYQELSKALAQYKAAAR